MTNKNAALRALALILAVGFSNHALAAQSGINSLVQVTMLKAQHGTVPSTYGKSKTYHHPQVDRGPSQKEKCDAAKSNLKALHMYEKMCGSL